MIDLCRSRTRAAVVRELFWAPGSETYVRALARVTGEAVANVHREVKRLQVEGWIEARPSGNRVLYRVDTGHRLFPAISSLVEDAVGATGLLREALAELRDLRLALLLRPTPDTGSRDLLVLVVGEVASEQVARALAPAAAALRATVRPLIFGREELLGRLRQHDARTVQLLEAPHTLLIGDEDAVRALLSAVRA
jgi:hypothetical protein